MTLVRRPAVSATVLILATLAYLAAGPFAAIAMVFLSPPLLGWAFDNHSGTFFVVGSLVTLISLMALAR